MSYSGYTSKNVYDGVRVREEAALDDIVERLQGLSRHEHSDMSIGEEAADELTALRAKCERYRDALLSFGKSGVRDRVAARVGCNYDILHDALQIEVYNALQEAERP